MQITEADERAALNFTVQDLESNRAGIMSARQRASFRNCLLLNFAALIISECFVVLSMTTQAKPAPPIGNIILMVIFFGFAGVYVLMCLPRRYIVLSYAPWRCFDMLAELRNGQVCTSSGKITLEKRENIGLLDFLLGYITKTHYYLTVHHLELEVDRGAYYALQTGSKYKLYYTPITKTLLSVECY